eukprot:347676-Pleurochrysis_carterae.AAC.3
MLLSAFVTADQLIALFLNGLYKMVFNLCAHQLELDSRVANCICALKRERCYTLQSLIEIVLAAVVLSRTIKQYNFTAHEY